jgi:hypothetical protein
MRRAAGNAAVERGLHVLGPLCLVKTVSEGVTGVALCVVADSDVRPPAGYHGIDSPMSAFRDSWPSCR